MAEPLLISFYTQGTIYEKEVEDLFLSCEALGLEHYIEARKDLGSWDQNCCEKPLFLLECLEKFNRPLIWVDADAIVLQKPSLEFQDVDMAFYFNDFSTKEVRSGTIYVFPTEGAKTFASQWYKACLEELAIRSPLPHADQGVLRHALLQFPLRIGRLPPEYIVIFDRDCTPMDKTVILHSQASRTALMPQIFWQHFSGKQLKEMRVHSSRNKKLP